MTYLLSLFNSVGDTRPQPVERTWEQLCAKFASPTVREEKDGLLFSPARYSGNRRLQRYVIELSLLVLEVDGAWQCDACGYKAPLVLFRNAKHTGDRCPECKKRDKKLEHGNISQIQFEMPELVNDVRNAVQSAFAIYSTHSHKRVTCSASVAESRFRIVVPLSEPIPVERFRELWQWAAGSLQTIPADPQDKDPNRIYYTPVKSSVDAIYEFHIEEGSPLDWRAVLDGNQQSAISNQANTNTEPRALTTGSSSDGYKTHEDRNDELTNRIMARGKKNSQGNWDAKCLAHGGKGNTALAYFPATGAVKCNRGCYYYDLLAAEGLSTNPLPSRERLALTQAISSNQQSATSQRSAQGGSNLPNAHCPSPTTSAAKLHAIYGLLLAHFFVLTAKDETDIRRDWKLNPYGDEVIALPGLNPEQVNKLNSVVKHCSMPTLIEQATACRGLLTLGFDLRGVPGFYRIEPRAVPGEPSRASQVDQWAGEEFGSWRLHLPYRKGLLVGYTNGTGYLLGIKIYRSTKDPSPCLLTSRGLPSGTRAVAVKESVAA